MTTTITVAAPIETESVIARPAGIRVVTSPDDQLTVARGDELWVRLAPEAGQTIDAGDGAGRRLEIRKNGAADSYAATDAALVTQTRQREDRDIGVFPAGAIVKLDKDCDGQTLNRDSLTHFPAVRIETGNAGDASVPAISINAELRAAGAGGFNECAAVSGEMTNAGSDDGRLTGWDVELRDGGRDTTIYNLEPRIALTAASQARESAFIHPIALGTRPPDYFVRGGPDGLAEVGVIFGFRDWSITTGRAMELPNGAAFTAEKADGDLEEFMRVDAGDNLLLRPLGARGDVLIRDERGVTRISAGQDGVGFFGARPRNHPGYGAATGFASRATFNTTRVSTAALAQRVKAIIDDLKSYGLFA